MVRKQDRTNDQESFSIECHKTKTNAISMTNRNKHKQNNKPMRTHNKYTLPVPSAGKHG